MKITSTTKEGTRVLNKVNGKVYEMVSVPDGTTDSTDILAVNVNPETDMVYDVSEEERDTVTITEQNAICFKTLSVPKDTNVPSGYTVSNGILYKNEEPVTEQGQIVVDNIVCALPGYLVLAVKPKTDAGDGMIDLFSYNVERDRFKKLIRASIPMPRVVLKQKESVVLGYSKTHTEDVLDEDGEKTGKEKEIFDGAALMLVHDERVDSVMFHRPVNLVLLPVAGGQGLYLIEAGKVAFGEEVEETKPYYYEIFVKEDSVSSETLAYEPDAPVVSASVVTLYDRGLFLKGKDYILYNDLRIDSPLVAQMPGEYLVDITYGDHEVTVTLADENYNTASIVRKNTKDRGYIVTRV